jgi:hypothetical protein
MAQILYAIARGIGIPLVIDEATSSKYFGYYGRILVDLDQLENFSPKLLPVERDGYAFSVDMEYERLPSLFSFCHVIVHSRDRDSCHEQKNTKTPRK